MGTRHAVFNEVLRSYLRFSQMFFFQEKRKKEKTIPVRGETVTCHKSLTKLPVPNMAR